MGKGEFYVRATGASISLVCRETGRNWLSYFEVPELRGMSNEEIGLWVRDTLICGAEALKNYRQDQALKRQMFERVAQGIAELYLTEAAKSKAEGLKAV